MILKNHIIIFAIISSFFQVTFAKIFDRCELAETLLQKHYLTYDQVNIWVCIAKYQSGLNSGAVNYDSQGIGYHGLFQISDQYWCTAYGDLKGKECNMPCSHLQDDDLTDDFACISKIFVEHERLSGSGYNAWTAYQNYCFDNSVSVISDCFISNSVSNKLVSHGVQTKKPRTEIAQNKVYHRCELARELHYVHEIPMEQLATWVCIAKHESGYNTSAEGHLNEGGSIDHGLFQISDIYWCSPPGIGWVCGISCAQLKDSDITDDVRCIKTIYEEHQRLSGDGFNAWAVYKPYCQYRSEQYIDGCFGEDDQNAIIPYAQKPKRTPKVYERCELANELRKKHKIPMDELATWVCIAYHESQYNTSAVGRLNADGSADHGIFQISDIYWCSPPGTGKGCGLTCAQLEDDDITDDVRCMRLIHEEHERISGDGFTAWAVYNPYCRGRLNAFITGCFDDNSENVINDKIPQKRPAVTAPPPPPLAIKRLGTGKVYDRCELARELYYTHSIPMEQISTWVCIAKHESSFNTSAIGRLNADGSGDHGLFQISDIYWCSPPGKGWVCGLSCAQLEDSDITDDVECMKKIHEEHQRLSGDGFNAWSVYNPHCRGRSDRYITGCFEDNTIDEKPFFNSQYRPGVVAPTKLATNHVSAKKTVSTGKVYNRCELAIELRDKHNIPMEQIATWVCIAHRESRYNTSAIGRLNGDGSGDHGLFQISDIYWCSPPGKGWVCGLSCSDLENDDITDDVECMRIIFEEHQRLSGNGFNAWAVYQPYCKGRESAYIDGCFSDKTTTKAPKTTTTKVPQTTSMSSAAPRTTTQMLSTKPNKRPSTTKQVPRTVAPLATTLATTNAPATTRTTTTKRRPSVTTQPPVTKRTTARTRPSATTRTTHPPTTKQSITSTRKSTATSKSPVRTTTVKNIVTVTKPFIVTTTKNPFAIYLNNFQTKKPSTFYKFSTPSSTLPTTTIPTKIVQRLQYPLPTQSQYGASTTTTTRTPIKITLSPIIKSTKQIIKNAQLTTDSTSSNSDVSNKILSIAKLNQKQLFSNLTTNNFFNYITSASDNQPIINFMPSSSLTQLDKISTKSSYSITQRPFKLDQTIAHTHGQTTTLASTTQQHSHYITTTKMPIVKSTIKFTLAPKSTSALSNESSKVQLVKQTTKSQFDRVFDLFVH